MELTKQQEAALAISATYKSLEDFLEKNEKVGTVDELTTYWETKQAEKKAKKGASATNTPAIKEGASKTEKTSKVEKTPKTEKVKEEKAPKAEKAPKEEKEKKPKVEWLKITTDVKAIIDSQELSKSDKFRTLHNLGMPIGQLVKEFDTYYSFVKSAIDRGVKMDAELAAEKTETPAKKSSKKEEVVVEEPIEEVIEEATEEETKEVAKTTPKKVASKKVTAKK